MQIKLTNENNQLIHNEYYEMSFSSGEKKATFSQP